MKKSLLTKFIRISALCMSFITAAAPVCFADAEIRTLSADTDSIFRTVGKEMFGVGGEWGADSSVLAVDYPNNTVNTKLVEDLKSEGLSFEFYRQAGASSVGYRWKDDIGLLYTRKNRSAASSLYGVGISPFGVLEQAKIARAFDGSDAKIVYTVSMVEENPQDMADLAEFLRGDGKINYNGGVNWANERIKHGIKDPVEVFAWELGNEYDASQSSHMFVNSDMYVQQCKEYIAAIRSVDPDAKISFCAPMLAAPVESRESYWVYNGLLELLPLIDYVTIHGYVAMDNSYRRDAEMLIMAEELKKLSGGRVKLINTEYNAQGTLSEKEGTDATAWGYGSPMYFAGARTIADSLCRYIKCAEMVSTNIYSAVDGTSYSICYLDPDDNKYKLNAAGYALSLFQNYAVGDAVECELEGFEFSKKADCAAAMVKDKDGYLNVILVNNTNDRDFYIDFDFDKKFSIEQIHTVKADKPYSLNYIGVKEILRNTADVHSGKAAEGYNLEKLTIAALKLKEIK